MQLEHSWLSIVFNACIVYSFIFLMARLVRKKQFSKFSPLDILVILIASRSIELNAIGRSSQFINSILFVVILLGLNFILSEISYRFQWVNNLVKGRPEVIMLNGKPHKKILKKLKVSEDELFEAIRNHEIMKTEDVKCAILETDGEISVIKYNH